MIPLGIRAGVEREARRLVGLQHLDSGGGEQPEHGREREHARHEQHGELPPADAHEEEHCEERGSVDESGAEVGLHEHEQDRRRAEAEDREDRPPTCRRADTPDDEPGERKHEEDLPELGRLELDDAEVDRPLRAADRLGAHEDDDHEPERHSVDELPVPAPQLDRHEGDHDEPDRPHGSRRRLADDVVVLGAGHVEARDAGDHPEAVADEAGGGCEQDPVEARQERDERML